MLSREEFYKSKWYTRDEFHRAKRIVEMEKQYANLIGNIVTRHHKVAQENGGSSIKANLAQLKQREHTAHHAIYDNLEPHEQIEHNVQLNYSTFSTRMRRLIRMLQAEIDELVEKHGVYKNWIYR